jgi:hypothetical protein
MDVLTNVSETGFARIAGMEEDLHLIGLQYNIASAILFVGNHITWSIIWLMYYMTTRYRFA